MDILHGVAIVVALIGLPLLLFTWSLVRLVDVIKKR